MKKYNKQDQRSFATWAADCAERVLPFFEKATAHVPQHALGGAYYALKAVAVADPANAEVKIATEKFISNNGYV